MLEVQQAEQENFLPAQEEKITFTPQEWKHFCDEIKLQTESTEPLNFATAINNARYLAMLDESIRQGEEGKVVSFTEEEWEKFANE